MSQRSLGAVGHPAPYRALHTSVGYMHFESDRSSQGSRNATARNCQETRCVARAHAAGRRGTGLANFRPVAKSDEVERWFAETRPPSEKAMRRVRDIIVAADRRITEYVKYGTVQFKSDTGDFANFVQVKRAGVNLQAPAD